MGIDFLGLFLKARFHHIVDHLRKVVKLVCLLNPNLRVETPAKFEVLMLSRQRVCVYIYIYIYNIGTSNIHTYIYIPVYTYIYIYIYLRYIGTLLRLL